MTYLLVLYDNDKGGTIQRHVCQLSYVRLERDLIVYFFLVTVTLSVTKIKKKKDLNKISTYILCNTLFLCS